MREYRRWLCRFRVVAIALITVSAPALAETKQTVKAFAAWQGRGQIFETGEERTTFVGAFSGMVYVESEQGPLDAGFMVCPAVVDIDEKSGAQQMKGRCTIAAKDGARAYAEMSCEGVHLVGCRGEFKFTGGTERFTGIEGGGAITVRSSLHEVAVGAGNIIQESASGIIVWPELVYTLRDNAGGTQ